VPTEKRQRQKEGRQARLAAEQKRQKRRRTLRRTITVVIVAGVVFGLSYAIFRPGKNKSAANATSTTAASTTTTAAVSAAQTTADQASKAAGCPSSPTAQLPNPQWKSAPPMTIDPNKTYTATINTDVGPITATLDAKTAPVAVNDFVFLVDQKYYNCLIFHRVIPSFMDQTGDPTGTGSGSVGYTVQGEVPATANPQYPIGSLAMAKTSAAPNGTSSNQFFIVAGSEGESLPPDYALFGQVTAGQDVVDKINADGNPNPSDNGTPPTVTHRMLSVTVATS
jgi:cyclophilin family peptidyl-prolyl cis-trans isomerase